jgi:hypothetical protein
MKQLIDMSLDELYAACCCSQDALDGEAPACEPCFIRGAIEAGIPRAVIAGRAKLRDSGTAECDAYETDDPKHPTYRERMLDAADIQRKQRNEI